jgi:hypothetical protein
MSQDLTDPLVPSDPIGAILSELRELRAVVDARSRETRPMSERVDQILAEVSALSHEVSALSRRMGAVEDGLEGLGRRMGAVEDRLESVDRSFIRFQRDNLDRYMRLDDRVVRIEEEKSP